MGKPLRSPSSKGNGNQMRSTQHFVSIRSAKRSNDGYQMSTLESYPFTIENWVTTEYKREEANMSFTSDQANF